jgi:hypothetical protein
MVFGAVEESAKSASIKKKYSLKQFCEVSQTGKSFVGIKVDGESFEIHFPIGYKIPSKDELLRQDIRNLMEVLARHPPKNPDGQFNRETDTGSLQFPFQAYMGAIEYYLNYGVYVEKESIYKTGTRGKINWPKTIRDQIPLTQIKNNTSSLVYTQFAIRSLTTNANKLITQINRYCVCEAFRNLGWLYGTHRPEPSGSWPGKDLSMIILNTEMGKTFDDNKRALFRAMIDILDYQGGKHTPKKFKFGTEHFYTIWEEMVNVAFGSPLPPQPEAKWILRPSNQEHPASKLRLDSLMHRKDCSVVIDSKYMRYGVTMNIGHLPKTSEINKQLTYADHILKKLKLDEGSLYNAFVLPFCKDTKSSLNNGEKFQNVGEAIGKWRIKDGDQLKHHERIQAILIDTRYLMYNYQHIMESDKDALVSCIKNGLKTPLQ